MWIDNQGNKPSRAKNFYSFSFSRDGKQKLLFFKIYKIFLYLRKAGCADKIGQSEAVGRKNIFFLDVNPMNIWKRNCSNRKKYYYSCDWWYVPNSLHISPRITPEFTHHTFTELQMVSLLIKWQISELLQLPNNFTFWTRLPADFFFTAMNVEGADNLHTTLVDPCCVGLLMKTEYEINSVREKARFILAWQ